MTEDKQKTANDQISIYIPTHPKSSADAIQQDKTRYKNALQEIDDTVSNNQLLSGSFEELKSYLGDLEFWKKQNKGLAVFANTSGIHVQKLPVETSTKTTVGKYLMKTPLLMTKTLEAKVIVIDFSLNHTRAFLNSYKNEPVDLSLKIVPMKEYLELDHQDNQQFHTPGGSRSSTPQFHGHGGGGDLSDVEEVLYMQYLADEVEKHVSNYELPVILSGEKNRIEQFRKIAGWKDELDLDIYGNNESKSLSELNDTVNHRLTNLLQVGIQEQATELKNNGANKMLKGYDKILDAAKRSVVGKLYVPMLMKTKDSVRSGLSDSLVLDLSEYNEKIEELVDTVVKQGGLILPTLKASKNNGQLLAELRY